MPASDQGVALSHHRYQLVPRVLCFVTYGAEVLLLKGAPTKRLWANRYNGLGGHVERDEGVHAAARREIKEESGLEVRGLRLCGVITIHTGEPAGIGLYVFTAEALSRETVASGEGALEWAPRDRLGEYALVEDLPTLLPVALAHAPGAPPFSATYRYDAGGRLVIAFDAP